MDLIRPIIHNLKENRGFFRSFPRPMPEEDGRKHLLIMISSMKREGSQKVACLIASGLEEECDVTVLCGNRREDSFAVDERVKIETMPPFHYDLFRILSAFYVKKIKKSFGIDVSFSMLFGMNVLNVITRTGERVIVSERNDPRRAYPKRFIFTKFIYTFADHVVFQTEEVRSMYSRRVRAHSSILPNPVSVSCMAGESRGKRVVNAARLHKNKNQELLIRAFARFHEAHPEYTLTIYGEGEEEQKLRALTEQLGIEKQVQFPGNVPDLHEQIRDAGFFVLSSDTEGMPNALLEAMMMGLPCISTDCTGSADVIDPEENGLLVPRGDEEALAAAMTRFAEDPDFAKKMAEGAKRTAAAFEKTKALEEWKKLLTAGEP